MIRTPACVSRPPPACGLRINGRYDFFFRVETSQQPLFQLLGAPAADKRHVVAEGGPWPPQDLLVKETVDWLDRYLGPVRIAER